MVRELEGMETMMESAPLVLKGFGGRVGGVFYGGTPPILKNQTMPMSVMQGFISEISPFGQFDGSESRVYRESNADIGTILIKSIIPQQNRMDHFPIFVKTLRGTLITLLTTTYICIYNLKWQIKGKTHILFALQLLMHGGKILVEDYCLSYYSITKYVIIFLNARIQGGIQRWEPHPHPNQLSKTLSIKNQGHSQQNPLWHKHIS